MIPKIIHFCWLSNDPYPPLIQKCLDSWKRVMPDYEIRKWDMSSFDINSVQFVHEAYSLKKWAFAADYIRLYALYNYGGIYLDSDVFVKKSFDPFLDNNFFSSIEYTDFLYEGALNSGFIDKYGHIIGDRVVIPGLAIQAAIMGAKQGNKFIEDCLKYYDNKSFILENSEINNKVLSPNILAYIAKDYGFKYLNQEQLLQDGIRLYPAEYFAGFPALETKKSYAVHCCAGSWRKKNWLDKVEDYIRSILLLMKLKQKKRK